MRLLTRCASMMAIALSLSAPARAGSLPEERAIGHLEPVFEFNNAMPTGITVAAGGRIFVNFPRWGDTVPFTVGEIRGSKVVAYPDAAVNQVDATHPKDRFLSVQSVVADQRNRLWVLDTAAPSFSTPIAGGAKLVAIDLATNRIAKTIVIGAPALLPTTYLNDVRFDFRQGKEGIAYITDSSLNGPGGLIMVDLATGAAWRRLNGHRSTQPDPDFVPVVEGETMMVRTSGKAPVPFRIASDGIALSPDGATLYFSPLSSRHLFAVPTALLWDRDIAEDKVAASVTDLGEKGASDGLEADAVGRVYATDYEHNSIRRRANDGSWETIAHDPRLLWPDTMSLAANGYLYVTANQIERQPLFHDGKDLRQKPYTLFRLKVDSAPAPQQ